MSIVLLRPEDLGPVCPVLGPLLELLLHVAVQESGLQGSVDVTGKCSVISTYVAVGLLVFEFHQNLHIIKMLNLLKSD